MKDNDLYNWSLTQESTEPEIYFDEKDEADEKYADSLLGARLVISMLIDASNNNTNKLQALMCIFAGMSLREAGSVCNKSYEYVRLQIESIKDSHKLLYNVLIDKTRYKVTSLIPMGKSKKWKIIDRDLDKTIYTDNLFGFCRDKSLQYSSVQNRIRCANGVYLNYTITKQF